MNSAPMGIQVRLLILILALKYYQFLSRLLCLRRRTNRWARDRVLKLINTDLL